MSCAYPSASSRNPLQLSVGDVRPVLFREQVCKHAVSSPLRQDDAPVEVPADALLVHTASEVIALVVARLTDRRTQLGIASASLASHLGEPRRLEHPLAGRRAGYLEVCSTQCYTLQDRGEHSEQLEGRRKTTASASRHRRWKSLTWPTVSRRARKPPHSGGLRELPASPAAAGAPVGPTHRP